MAQTGIINTMEVLDALPLSDLLTEVVIKVCYVSDEPNRNNTVINRKIGQEIASTLPGAPVVGFFDKNTNDFEEHSRHFQIEDGALKVDDVTVPYGFVAPELPWYQDFNEDGIVRTYLMCKAYLWTNQYEEAKHALGKGQSMELSERTMAGYYQGDVFVFTSATLDKLCILGDEYTPCFEGAKIISSYAREYTSLTQEVAKTTGRRYSLMGNQEEIKTTPQTVSLQYALGLGWELQDTVRVQMDNNGLRDYYIEGLFEESGQKFVIAKEQATGQMVKIDFEIFDDETVNVKPKVTAVKLSWDPVSEEKAVEVKPINGENPLKDASLAASEIPTAFSHESEDGNGGNSGDEGETEEVTVDREETTVEEEEVTVEGEEEILKDSAKKDESKGKGEEKVEIANIEDNLSNSGDGSLENESAPVQALAEDVTSFSTDNASEVGELKAKIAELESIVATYKQIAEEVTVDRKKAMLESYSTLLEGEQLTEISNQLGEFSLEQLEAKLAITFARQQQEKKQSAQTAYQLDIKATSTDGIKNDALPEFIKQAKALDNARPFGLA